MGLLDQLLGQALGNTAAGQQHNQLLDLAVNFVQNYPGGVAGLVQQFTNAGYGGQARSWVSTGENVPISQDELSHALGPRNVESMGRQAGLPAQTTSGALAALLPVLIRPAHAEGPGR